MVLLFGGDRWRTTTTTVGQWQEGGGQRLGSQVSSPIESGFCFSWVLGLQIAKRVAIDVQKVDEGWGLDERKSCWSFDERH